MEKTTCHLKKTAAILLTACMILALAACGGGAGQSSTATAAPDTAAPVATDAATEAPPDNSGSDATQSAAPDVIKFITTNDQQRVPVEWHQTEINKEILAMANVELDYYYLDEDKFSLALASSDLGDFVMSHLTPKLNTVLDAGLAMDIKPLLKEHCPNALNEYNVSFVNLVSQLSGGDKLYFMPQYVGRELVDGGIENLRGYFLRWDYYKEIGAPPVDSDKDFADAMERMVAAHPTTPDGKKVWGLGIYNDLWEYFMHGAMTTALCNPWTFSGYLYMHSVKTLDLVNGYMDPEKSAFWNTVLLYNDLYNRGLFDPDSFTMTVDDFSAKYAAGQYVGRTNWRGSELYDELLKEDPNTLGGLVGIPSKNSIVFGNNPTPCGWYPSFYLFIPSNSEKWEATLRLFNFLYDPDIQRRLFSGAEGKYWNYVNGVPTPTDEAISLFRGSERERNTRVGIGMPNPFLLFYEDTIIGDGYPVSVFETPEMRASNLTPLLKDVAAHYGVDYPSQEFYKYVARGDAVDWSKTYGTELIALSMTEMSPDTARILTKCNDILMSNVADLIKAPTRAEYDAIQARCLEEMKATGEADAWDWCSKEFIKSKEFCKSVMGY